MRANISRLLAMAPGLIVKNSLNDKDEVAIARNLCIRANCSVTVFLLQPPFPQLLPPRPLSFI